MPKKTPIQYKQREGPHGPAILLIPFGKDDFPEIGKKEENDVLHSERKRKAD